MAGTKMSIYAAILLAIGALSSEDALAADAPHDEAVSCSNWLRNHDSAGPLEKRRRCVIAVASTYVDAEENSAPEEEQLVTDDIARHRPDKPANFMPGNRVTFLHQNAHVVISAIKNRQWTVDGNTAWILYDGYLKASPDKPSFYVAERFTLEKGLIREILVAGVTTVGK